MKKLKVFLATFLLAILFSINCYAANGVQLEANKTELKSGDEVIVSIHFGEENANLDVYTAKLSYDENVFEKIATTNFEDKENWSDVTYNSNNNKFALVKKSRKRSGKRNFFTSKTKSKRKCKCRKNYDII